ncbi:MAG: DUF2341 domain-containing protein, partial [Chitinispirillaceae bacterium]|nr:DUF2341 domain-containing protein [Chitinispirillaceae bacterium]
MLLLLAITALLVSGASVHASKVTVDADGGAEYTSLDAVLSAIESNSIDPDTIEFVGNDQDTYSWSTYMSRTNVGSLLLRSKQTNPNFFPLINRSGDVCWNFFQNTNVYFENLILPDGSSGDVYAWTNAQSLGKTLSFKRCIIRDQSTDYFLKMEGGGDNTVIFENCLFEGNVKIFTLDYWGGSPAITITNCTFDNNTELFSGDLYIDRAANVSIKNCLFSGNTNTFPSGDVFKGKTTYSLTSEATTGYGSGCISNSNPRYVSATRSEPSNWMILSNSPAQNLGTATGAPSTDISGYPRSGNPDAGCWEVQNRDYLWDISTTSGIQAGSGTWGSNNYWTVSGGNGTTLVAWPGVNNTATFAGTDGKYTITINGTQSVDSITFSNSGYTLSGGTALNFNSKNGIYVASGKSAVIGTPITGTNGITLSGGGILMLSGTNTYTGATTVSGGTLLITGSTASGDEVSVSNNATLGGTGTVGGTVTANGTISPGTTGTGILTINNSLAFTQNGVYRAAINGKNAGSEYDRIVMKSGTLTLGNAALSLTLGFAPAAGNTFTIIDNAGPNPVSGTFKGLSENDVLELTYSGTAYRFTISYRGGSGNNVVLTMAAVIVPENYAAWSYQKTLILNTASTGAAVAGNVTDFPVLVRLNPGNFSSFSQTLPGGADVRFSKTDGTHIPYQIERWIDNTGNNDTADIWIKIDTICGNTSTQAFNIHWGKSGAVDSSNGSAVFDTANGFTAAYFLNEASGSAIDYSANSLSGSANGSVPKRQAGVIGFGQRFDGNGDYFDAGNSGKFDMSTDDEVTVMAWVKPAGDAVAGSIEGIAGKWEWSSGEYQEYLLGEHENNGFFFGVSSNGSDYTFLYNTVPTNGTWYHVTGTMNGNKMFFFVNGIARDSSTERTAVFGSPNSAFRIGISDDNGSDYRQFFNGTIDQVTVAKTARSADWVKLCYENQKTEQTLILYSGDYTWDNSTASGIQTGNGTWGTDHYWTLSNGNGTSLVSWLGTGNSATFAGKEGSYAITVVNTQTVDSISFLNGTYTLNSGTINLGTKKGIYVAADKNAVIGSVINGSSGLSKTGSGILTLTGTNTYTGATAVYGGTLLVNGSLAAESDVTVASGATLGGTGICGGAVIVNGGTIAPGSSGPGKLSTSGLALNAASILNFDLGAKSDTIAVTGALTLDGTINFTAAAGFAADTFRLITCSGTLTDKSLDIGTWPAGMDYKLVSEEGHVDVIVTTGLIKTEPKDTFTVRGRRVSFTVSAEGEGTLAYTWLRFPDDSVGNAATFSFTADTSARFRCVVRDSFGVDSSRWALLTVIDTPRIVVQPHDTGVTVGENAVVSLSVKDTVQVTYSWKKTGSTTVVSTTASLSIDTVAFSDSGGYYCLVTNPAATVSTDTARLTVNHIPPSINTQPVDLTALVGDSIWFTVAATGNAPPSYTWKKAGSDEDISTAETYTIPKVSFSDSGDYYCIVSNPGGSISSDTVHLTVKHPPPSAAFSFTPKSGQVPLSIEFADVSSGVITSRTWRFGDDGTGDAANPTHVYAKPGLYTVTLIVKGPGGTDSLVKRDSVFAYAEGSNPVRMTARFLSGTDVEITLIGIEGIDTLPPTPECDSMGIWIKSGALPIDSADGTLIIRYRRPSFTKQQIVDTVTLPSEDSLYGLMSVLFWHDGSLSDFLEVNGCMVFLRKTPKNPLTLAAAAITDTSIRLSWNEIIDTAITGIRIWYGTSIIDTGLFIPSGGFDSLMLSPADTSFVITGLAPSTTYYFGIQAAKGMLWSNITAASRTSCRTLESIADFGREVVTFFNPGVTSDTVRVFKGAIVLWKDSTYTATALITDTLEAVKVTTPPRGMIVVGIPFLFKKGDAVLPFHVGIRIQSLPNNKSLNDVRMYRDSAGSYIACYESAIDSVHDVVSIKTADLRWPFIAMIDTVPPEVTIYSDTASAVYSTATLKDSLRIDDNIVNVRWRYCYNRGDDIPQPRVEGELRSTSSEFSLLIPDTMRVISSESGFRALLVISDGAHVDTVNLSRSVVRFESDKLKTEPDVWIPIYPTAVLSKKNASQIIGQLSPKRDPSRYDRRYMRLYRWFNYADNANEIDKWVEYDPNSNDISSLFTLEPGRLFWLKTRDEVQVHLDSAQTLSLKDTFTVSLPPEQWTDFGMPYRFGVRIQEILTASCLNNESLLFYRWEKVSNSYITTPLYVSVIPDMNDPAKIIEYLPRGGYSVYNTTSKTILLSIPPILPSMVKTLAKSAKEHASSWSTKFIA